MEMGLCQSWEELSVRRLGLLLDPAWLLDVQVAAEARGAFFQFGQVGQLWPFLDRRGLALVTLGFDHIQTHSIIIMTAMWGCP